MEAGDWDGAVAAFGTAMKQGSDNTNDASTTSKKAAACYAAAALLLKAAANAASADDALAAARLSRFAAALPLEPRHADALSRAAAARNARVGNHGYAADRWLACAATATESGGGSGGGGSGGSSAAALAELQARLDDADAAGGQNAALPADEDTQSFAEIVASAGDVGEVVATVGGVVSG